MARRVVRCGVAELQRNVEIRLDVDFGAAFAQVFDVHHHGRDGVAETIDDGDGVVTMELQPRDALGEGVGGDGESRWHGSTLFW